MHAAMTGQSIDSALAQAGFDECAVSSKHCGLQEVTGLTLLALRSLEPTDKLTTALLAAGIQLPNRVNHSAGTAPAVLCLRPDEWLLVSAAAAGTELRQRLTDHLDPARSFVLERSDGLAVFRLTGSAAAWLLSKLSGLDFLSARGVGQHCAGTRMAQSAVTVHYHPVSVGEFCFDLFFDRSIAPYLWHLLKASMPHADELAESFSNCR